MFPNDGVILFCFTAFPRRLKLGCFAFTCGTGILAIALAVDGFDFFLVSSANAFRNPKAMSRSVQQTAEAYVTVLLFYLSRPFSSACSNHPCTAVVVEGFKPLNVTA